MWAGLCESGNSKEIHNFLAKYSIWMSVRIHEFLPPAEADKIIIIIKETDWLIALLYHFKHSKLTTSPISIPMNLINSIQINFSAGKNFRLITLNFYLQ